ncbi:MAG TPA: hypothetical protein VKN35_15725 [Xanthomonadales bacterium]|nr:hypothetical protein [Xanthomonadales bacterium]
MSTNYGFFEELKRRNVVRVGVVYLVIAWILAQVADLMLENFEAPGWVIKAILLVLIIGFPISLVFAWAFELTPEGLKKERDVDRSQSITHKTGRRLDFAIIGILLIAVAFLLFDRFGDSAPEKGSEPFSKTAALEQMGDDGKRALTPFRKSIAVLPFVNMSDDASNEYFSDGISEEILNALAKVKELKVAGRTSSFAFKGENQDLRQIGETLGVEHILEGSVRKAGDRLRITAQLIQVNDGFHLWSESYDRELDDVFAIQDEISQAILSELKTTLLGDEQIASTQTQTGAYENYLLARQRIYDRTESSLLMAEDLLSKAIETDPEYAPAYAQLGIATMLLSDENYGSIPNSEAGARALPLIERALELDPQLAEAMAARGLYATVFELDLPKGVEWLEKAVATNPNLTIASVWLALTLETMGDTQGAIRIYEAAHERDPFHPVTQNNLVVDYTITGQNERALALLERAREVQGTTPEIQKSEADIRVNQGELAIAITEAEAAHKANPQNGPLMLTLGFSYLVALDPERALTVNTPRVQILALHQMGRTEEASILGFEQAAAGRVWPEFFQVLAENGQSSELVEFVESRWASLDDYEAIYPPNEANGAFMMAFIAQAYGQSGDESKFNDAMTRLEDGLNHQLRQGANNPFFHFTRGFHSMLAGDRESAVDYLETAFSKGFGFSFNDPRAWTVFTPLNGDPRYESAKAGMVEHINAERQKLGWEPVSI